MPLKVEAQPYQAWIRDEKGTGIALVYDPRFADLFARAEEMQAALRVCADALFTSREPWARSVLDAIKRATPKDIWPEDLPKLEVCP